MDSTNRSTLGQNLPNARLPWERTSKIVLDKISFPNMTLSAVLRRLTEENNHEDPEHEGISFFLKIHSDKRRSENQFQAPNSGMYASRTCLMPLSKRPTTLLNIPCSITALSFPPAAMKPRNFSPG